MCLFSALPTWFAADSSSRILLTPPYSIHDTFHQPLLPNTFWTRQGAFEVMACKYFNSPPSPLMHNFAGVIAQCWPAAVHACLHIRPTLYNVSNHLVSARRSFCTVFSLWKPGHTCTRSTSLSYSCVLSRKCHFINFTINIYASISFSPLFHLRQLSWASWTADWVACCPHTCQKCAKILCLFFTEQC